MVTAISCTKHSQVVGAGYACLCMCKFVSWLSTHPSNTCSYHEFVHPDHWPQATVCVLLLLGYSHIANLACATRRNYICTVLQNMFLVRCEWVLQMIQKEASYCVHKQAIFDVAIIKQLNASSLFPSPSLPSCLPSSCGHRYSSTVKWLVFHQQFEQCTWHGPSPSTFLTFH